MRELYGSVSGLIERGMMKPTTACLNPNGKNDGQRRKGENLPDLVKTKMGFSSAGYC